MKSHITLRDVSDKEGTLATVAANDLLKLPVEFEPIAWKELSGETQDNYCCILDDVLVLRIPRPKTPEEEEKLVNRFLDGMRKLLDPDNNWTFLSILETSLNYCAQCNSCAQACHLFEVSNRNEMYRPNLRSELFRRIYKQYIARKPFAKWRYGDVRLNWKTVARLGEMAYRCTLCRRCAQTCPIGVDNALIAREIRKVFSQELGISPPELHDSGSMLQLDAGPSIEKNAAAAQKYVAFIDEKYSAVTGYTLHTPWDVQGADILFITNVDPAMADPVGIAAFSIIFQKAGLSFTLSSELAGYGPANYGTFYDDVQFARTAILHMRAAKKLGVQRIVIGECGHVQKALTVIADRVLPRELNIPRESCFPVLRDIVFSGKIAFDPSRNDFPVTLHDPCNIVRLMGVNKPQREILRYLCPQFREMTPHGVENYCCGGGSGFAVMTRDNIEAWRYNLGGRKKMSQICGAFHECLGPETKKYICAPCESCKVQISGMLERNGLPGRNSIHCSGIAELIVNAMVDLKPGFLE
ncbi:MAG: (Fe-S)-binding protein [Desulfovibrionaceae bacterium]|nr:(Fe-S)-binding protein [Desulfovibrionaceae bacterium]